MNRTPARARALAAAVTILVAGACADRPASTEPAPPEVGPPGAAPVHLVALDCVGDVRGGSLSCAPAAPAGGDASSALAVLPVRRAARP